MTQAPIPSKAGHHRTGAVTTSPAVRIDVWLVAVRLAKTRSIAAAACRSGRVLVNGHGAKPATTVIVGDRVEATLAGRLRIVEVTVTITKRTSASIAETCYVDHSPPPPSMPAAPIGKRERGAGRPTKKDRRQIDRLRGR